MNEMAQEDRTGDDSAGDPSTLDNDTAVLIVNLASEVKALANLLDSRINEIVHSGDASDELSLIATSYATVERLCGELESILWNVVP